MTTEQPQKKNQMPPNIGDVPWTRESAMAAMSDFIRVYAQRPVKDNAGGMQFNHCFAVWHMLGRLQPATVVESGVFKGQGTWLIEQACPNAGIVSLDVDFSRLVYHSERAEYIESDLMNVSWGKRDLRKAVFVFDDHMNAYRRLIEMNWLGCRRAIIEDNFPVGEGDAYSPRQMFAGVGRTRMQVSERYRTLIKEVRYYFLQRALRSKRVVHSQSVLVEPNDADWANLARRMSVYHEFPPVWLEREHKGWKTPWEGPYATRQPLLDKPPEGFDGDYGYIAYIELR